MPGQLRSDLPVYSPLSLVDLDAIDLPEPDWAIDQLLPRGSLTLLAGREKSGKSLLMTDLAASVAGGEPFLDHAVQPGPVLLVPAEENLRDVRQRLQRRLGGRTDPPLWVLPVNRGEADFLNLARRECLDALHAVIDKLEPAVLILDPFRELHNLAENDSDQMGPLLRPLRQLAHETDVSILLTHHMSRAGNFRGSTAIRASCDQEFAFRRPEESEVRSTELSGTLTIEGRFGPRQRLGIRLDEDLRWQLSVQAISASSSSRVRVLEHLESTNGPATAHDVAAQIGVELKTVRNVLTEGSRPGGPINRQGEGYKNKPYRYSLERAG